MRFSHPRWRRLPVFRYMTPCRLHSSLTTLNMNTASSSETLVRIYQSKWRRTLHDWNRPSTGPLPRSQGSATGLNSGSDGSRPHHQTLFQIHFNIILPPTPRYFRQSPPFQFSDQNFVWIFPPSHELYTLVHAPRFVLKGDYRYMLKCSTNLRMI